MFTNDSILHIAMQQSAIEYNCAIDAFMQQQSVITLPAHQLPQENTSTCRSAARSFHTEKTL